MIRDIAKEQYFYPKVKEIVSKALEVKEEGKVILIIGQPGSGKSVFMSQLYDELKDKVNYMTAIKAEFLHETDSPNDVYTLFEKVNDKDEPKVLLLDSLDALAYSRRRELQEWLYYVDKLKYTKGMTVICASRSFEAEHLYPMNEQDWSDKVSIKLLPDEFINRVFDKLGYGYKNISPKFRDFLRIPLHLKVTAEIIQRRGDPKEICTLQGLYAKLCELLNISTGEMSLLSELAESMIKNRTIYLAYPSLGVQLLDNIKNMERPGITGIIQIDSTNQRLSFSHQTLIDYFSAWKVINEDKPVIDFILEHKQSLFIRPVLRHILGFFRLNSEKRLFEELGRLFFEEEPDKKIGFIQKGKTIRMHIKTAILANIASWDNPTVEEGKFILRLFRETKDGQTFMIQFFNAGPNPEWYNVLKDIFILPILRTRDDSDIEYRIILSFLAKIAKDKPSEILDISALLLTQRYNRTIERFFMRVSDELFKIELDNSLKRKYADILEQTVRKGFITWYYEVQITCNRIAKYFPEKGLRLYFDLVMKELQDKESKISSSQGSLATSFGEVLPSIYEKIPCQVLSTATEFFEQILSADYPGEKGLLDWPDELLYSKHAQRFGLKAFYDWYKNKILEFCLHLTDKTKNIIEKLQQSKWESQRQLSMLCKIRNVSYYKDGILACIKKILQSNLKEPSMYNQSELFIRGIEKIFKIISPQEREEIINSLLKLQFDDKLQVRVWIWKPLHHIPESFQDKRIKRKLEELRDKYNFEKEYKYKPPISSTGVQGAQPPVPAYVLRAKTPDELYKFLIENRDLKERWDFEKDIFYGDIEELAQEVAGIFVESLDKFKNVIENLSKDPENDEYLVWLFSALSQKSATNEDIDWIIELITSVYERERLQLETIRVLRKIANDLSEDQFNKLKDVLLTFSRAKDPEEDKFFEYRKQGYSNDALTEGINSTRGALVELVILLLQKFKERYLVDILEKLSKDKTISVRAALVRYLPYAIRPLGWDRCFELFSNAFEKGPEEYSEIIPQFLRYVPKDKFDKLEEILNKMKERRNSKLGEAYAVIMTIFYLRDLCSDRDLMGLLEDEKLSDKGKEESFNLLANQVKFEANVDKCLKIINNLIEQEDILKGRLSVLFMQARPEDLKKLAPIIKKIINKPKIRGETLYYILEYLEKSILVDPLLVF
ncbi:MAG: AAA family ATPase, partial [Candidatus Heimdallarchaeaceae archaeon]